MKMAKRILSLVLVLVMFASLSVTAFADGTSAPKIVVKIDTPDVQYTKTFEAAAGMKLNDAVTRYLAELNPQWQTVNDWQQEGVTHQALVSMNGLSTTPAASNNATRNAIIANGYEFDKWVPGHTGYAQLVSKDGDATPYHYLYVGYGWTYDSSLHMTNGEFDYIDLYMCCYTLSANETIYLNYDLSFSDWFSDTALA